MHDAPKNFQSDNLSVAWARAYSYLLEPGHSRSGPLMVSVRGDLSESIPESPAIREALDEFLKANDKSKCQTVANTIFPKSIWNPSEDRDVFFQRFIKMLPTLRSYPGNYNGMYFERMVYFGGEDNPETAKNQLDHIIKTFIGGNHRASALQLAIFDPKHDHTNSQQRGFPCLQQVAIVPVAKDKFRIDAFYPLHYFVDKAYGNYLGLARLGQFIGHETQLKFTGLNCYSVTAELSWSKTNLSDLTKIVGDELGKQN